VATHRASVVRMADALLEVESLDADGIKAIMADTAAPAA